ncbi:DUF433 domain-containing protein [Silvibacterium acidisoli]|uniref:DUF433 domain-containing protein n=1 Tax=Acidobacteriaceae bacterium ZG23-2 TaxID=2883246 RepID=UPI00406C03D6
MDRLEEARAIVVEDPEILSGTPVIKGTRVPVHDIAALFDAGTPVDEILKCYPSVKQRHVELASVYAQTFPAPKRPKESFVDLKHVKVLKRARLSLRSSSDSLDKTIS